MLLSISNLAWPEGQDRKALELLAGLGVAGVEVAPTRIAPWDELTTTRVREYGAMIRAAGLRVSALQAILFGAADAQLLGSTAAFDSFLERIARVSVIAAELGAGVMVFGAPKNRLLHSMEPDAAFDLAATRFGKVADILDGAGVMLGIEPVPAFYGGEFLARHRDVETMVRAVNRPSVRAHLDTGCVFLGGDSIAEAVRDAADILAHFHIAEPALEGFGTVKAAHEEAAEALRLAGYEGWLSIEMRTLAPDPWAEIERAVAFALRTYAGVVEG